VAAAKTEVALTKLLHVVFSIFTCDASSVILASFCIADTAKRQMEFSVAREPDVVILALLLSTFSSITKVTTADNLLEFFQTYPAVLPTYSTVALVLPISIVVSGVV